MSIDVGAILEGTVALLVEGAIHQGDVVHVAERLLATDMAAHQLDVLAVPSEVFSVQLRVIHRHVLTLPEAVLGRNLGMVYLHVLAVLENVLRVALQAIHVDIFGEHEWIGAIVQLHILQLQSIHLPEGLVGIRDVHALQF